MSDPITLAPLSVRTRIDLGPAAKLNLKLTTDGDVSGSARFGIWEVRGSYDAQTENWSVAGGVGRSFGKEGVSPLALNSFAGVGITQDGLFFKIAGKATWNVKLGQTVLLAGSISVDYNLTQDELEEFADAFVENALEAGEALADLFGGVGNLIDEPASAFGNALNAQLRRFIDPIVIDMDGNGIQLVARSDAAIYFDMDGDGIRERTGWIGGNDALLVIDENGNGIIDDIGELIGDLERSGFEELVSYDLNGDRIIDAGDAVFSRLRVWVDADSDGVTDAGELRSMAEAGLKSIDLRYETVNFTAEGNAIHEQSTFERTNGTTGQIVDAWFDVSNTDTAQSGGPTGNATIDALPDLRGYGDVAALRVAMLADGALTSLVSGLVGRRSDQLNGARMMAEEILHRWAGTGDVPADSRGDRFDARRLGTLEAFVGTAFLVGGSDAPGTAAAAALEQAWGSLVDALLARLMFAGSIGRILDGLAAWSPTLDRIVVLEQPGAVFAQLAGKAPAGSSTDAADYWAAVLPTMRHAYAANGVDTASASYADTVDAVLAEAGLNGFAGLLEAGVQVLPVSRLLGTDGVYMADDAAQDLFLTGYRQAVYGEGGNDRIVAGSTSSSSIMRLDGGDGADTLQGGRGNDWLEGGSGADLMAGGYGDDTYVIDDTGDIVIELRGAGTDTVRSAISYVLDDTLEHLTLIGTRSLAANGNADDNRITGNGSFNILRGLDGDDTLDGGGGGDRLEGGYGNDTYIVRSANDLVVEIGNGTDIVFAAVDYVLGDKVERLTLTGTAQLATGNDRDNVLRGNDGDNVLDGRRGADDMYGGNGNDIYVVDDTGDDVYEYAGGGDDLVRSSVSFDIYSTWVETVYLTGSLDIDAAGNELDNTLAGNAGDNRLDGRGGADRLLGGDGDDVYVVDNAGDTVIEGAGRGRDRVMTTLAAYTLGNHVEDLDLWTNSFDAVARSGTGNALANTIRGNNGRNVLRGEEGDDLLIGYDGDDVIDGGAGDDRIEGSAGADVMTGGAGNDVYVVGATGDRVIETAAANGHDTVESYISYTLGAHLEDLRLMGSNAIDGTGNSADNRIEGNDSHNRINGGAGADIMVGGRGDDTYIVDDRGDRVIEAAGEGTDTIRTTLSFSLVGLAVENLELIGTAATAGNGNDAANRLTGNDAGNILRGFDGNDYLDGGAGADRMEGGEGDDTYVVDDVRDVVIETGSGSDTVRSSIDYVLGARLENLVLTGTARNATGNDLNNRITGNDGDNVIDGGSGADDMYGGRGDDIYIISDEGDRVYENRGEGNDLIRASISITLGSGDIETVHLTGGLDLSVRGNGLDNTLAGNSGDNFIDGGGGADRLIGGDGDDTYVVDNIGDSVIEGAGRGTDTVQTRLADYTLSSWVENLDLFVGYVDSIARTGTGNELDNVIRGTDGVNTLKGLDGADTLRGYGGNDILEGGNGGDLLDGGTGNDLMTGHGGNDTYIVDSVGDRVVEDAGGGTDTVLSSISYILGETLENLELTGNGHIDGQGNAAANRLIGNSGNNALNGGGGADIMIGGAGNDTYTLDHVRDLVLEAPGGGIDTVRSSVNLALGIAVENAILLGTGGLSVKGNELDNDIHGNAGDNRLMGDLGRDILTGNTGADRFIWKDVVESGVTTSTADRITDFDGAAGDRIDVSAIDARAGTAANDAFTWIGAGNRFTAAGQVTTAVQGGVTYLVFNTDDDLSTTEMLIALGQDTAMSASFMIL
ncbi:beta strand repeat-containing protein [Tistrella mobilis]|uniref:beta strand repeat-containing protein n=1 Tax=Tistrella mobilis TaxID=171437 RepID=UPI003555D031